MLRQRQTNIHLYNICTQYPIQIDKPFNVDAISFAFSLSRSLALRFSFSLFLSPHSSQCNRLTTNIDSIRAKWTVKKKKRYQHTEIRVEGESVYTIRFIWHVKNHLQYDSGFVHWWLDYLFDLIASQLQFGQFFSVLKHFASNDFVCFYLSSSFSCVSFTRD